MGPGTRSRPGIPANDIDRRDLPRNDVGPYAPVARGAAAGTYYNSAADLAAQSAAVAASATAARATTYNMAMYQNYANAWTASHLVTQSLYTHPGYAALATGLGLAAQPVPYDYGGNVVTQSNAVYVNGDPTGTPAEYGNGAAQIANAGAADVDQDTKWLPLGVFAIVEGDATTSNDIFQLAVSKEGIIRGNYHNTAQDTVEPLSGSVDKKSQRAAWTIGGDKAPVYEAGIANLTKDATPILVHTEDGQSIQLKLIRLPDPG